MTQDLITGAGLLEPGQRNAEIVYNDMLLRLSALCADCVDSIGPTLPTTVSAPYLMILDGTHATRPNQIAYYWTTGQWFYVQPIKYLIYNNLADGVSYQFVGGSWQVSVFGGSGGGIGGVTIAQVNTAIATHAAADSHSMYLTQAEGDARYVLPSGLSELIDDRVAALLVAGSGTGLTYDDVLNRLTIALTGSVGSGGATGLKFILNTASGAPAVGEIRSPDLAAVGTIAINPTDTQASASDVLARLAVGAIVHFGKDSDNWVRGTVTTAWTAGSGSFAIGSVVVEGAIADSDTVYLSIVSDAPATVVGGTGRVTATSARTYYVRTTGTRTGSLTSETDATTNTDADAFGSITNCLNALKKLDFNGFSPTIFAQAGTFTEVVNLPTFVGTDSATLKGFGITSTTFTYDGPLTSAQFHGVIQSLSIFTVWAVEDCTITTTVNNRAAILCGNGKIFFRDIKLDSHYIDFWCLDSGIIEASGNYTVSRNKNRHIYCEGNGVTRIQGRSVTISGSVNFSEAGIFCAYGYPLVVINGNTYTGSATGKRYQSDFGGRIISSTGATYLPGTVNGTVNGGFYDPL